MEINDMESIRNPKESLYAHANERKVRWWWIVPNATSSCDMGLSSVRPGRGAGVIKKTIWLVCNIIFEHSMSCFSWILRMHWLWCCFLLEHWGIWLLSMGMDVSQDFIKLSHDLFIRRKMSNCTLVESGIKHTKFNYWYNEIERRNKEAQLLQNIPYSHESHVQHSIHLSNSLNQNLPLLWFPHAIISQF